MELNDPIETVPLIGLSYARKLKKLEISSIYDLLYHLPSRYVDYRHSEQINNLQAGKTATITGQIVSIQNIYTKKGKLMQVATLSDGENKISILWFNQPYLTRALPVNTDVSISGKVSFWQRKLVIFSPQYEVIKNGNLVHTGGLIPIYPETAGVSSKWLRSRINYVLKNRPGIIDKDYLDKHILEKYDLTSIENALKNIHHPSSPESALAARKRLAFDELLKLQVENSIKRLKRQRVSQSHKILVDKYALKNFINKLPFILTKSQVRSVDEITADLTKPHPMNRLLEGDVGSGKTIVAAAACYISFLNGYQSLIMAPTQILAAQHFETFKKILSPYGIKVALLASGVKSKDVESTNIVVGTHALIAKKVSYGNVALIVIDEQHRFGVKQRGELIKKGEGKSMPNVLTMTATPIPRTIALSLYGDLDLSTLDEIPNNRARVATWVVPENKRGDAYKWAEEQIKNEGTQAFVVCPLIEESENEALKEVKSVTTEINKLKGIFPNLSLGLLHGQLKSQEKEKVLTDFRNKKYDILVSTPVVEVGIDIPNATLMIVETSERYGLAALHQLRGRVGRGDKKSYCLLFTSTKGKKSSERLSALTKIHSGRKLAELDIKLRGAGEIFGTKQHGVGELKIATWQDIDLIKATKELAHSVVENQNKFAEILAYYKSKQIINN